MRLPSLHNLSIGTHIKYLDEGAILTILKYAMADGLKWEQLLTLKEGNRWAFSESKKFIDYCEKQDPGASIEIQNQHFEYCSRLFDTHQHSVLGQVITLHLRIYFKGMIANGLTWKKLLALKEVNPLFFYSSREFFDYCEKQDPRASVPEMEMHIKYCCEVAKKSEEEKNEVLRAVVALHLRAYMTYMASRLYMQRVPVYREVDELQEILKAAQCEWLISSSMYKFFVYARFGVDVHDTSIVVPDSAFEQCDWIDVNALPNSIEKIGTKAFAYCDELTLKSLPPNLKIVGSGAFSFCESIEEMTLPNSLLVLPASCFDNCTALKKVRLPNELTHINDAAFLRCINLKTIEGGLPKSLKYIGRSAFQNCGKLKLSVRGNIEVGKYAFYKCPKVTRLKSEDVDVQMP